MAHVLVSCRHLAPERAKFLGNTSLSLRELLNDLSTYVCQVLEFLDHFDFPIIFSRTISASCLTSRKIGTPRSYGRQITFDCCGTLNPQSSSSSYDQLIHIERPDKRPGFAPCELVMAFFSLFVNYFPGIHEYVKSVDVIEIAKLSDAGLAILKLETVMPSPVSASR